MDLEHSFTVPVPRDQAWAVLLDVARSREGAGRPLDVSTNDHVTVGDLQAALDVQGIVIESGDIVLLRFGWIAWYETLDQPARIRLADSGDFGAARRTPRQSTLHHPPDRRRRGFLGKRVRHYVRRGAQLLREHRGVREWVCGPRDAVLR